MSAKIGILGECTITASTTTTLYTVGTDKAQRVQIYMTGINGSGGVTSINLQIGSPGSEQTIGMGNIPADHSFFTGVKYDATNDVMLNSEFGLYHAALAEPNSLDTANGGGNMFVWAPLPYTYYLNDGDTVKFQTNGTVLRDVLVQVHGVEDDV